MRQIFGRLTNELENHTTIRTVGKDSGYFINTFRELVEQVAKLSYLNKDYLLFFRGQKNDYRNKANNSTFYPTIYRGEYLTQQELDYRFELLNSSGKILSALFLKNNIEGHKELRRKKFVQWSILQHYEVTETPLIDITQSLRVACSFAQYNNQQNSAYVYAFGLPYFTNRISTNSEHDLINIRLLSITPPNALRPYFQEGFLVGTDDLTNEYDIKGELDLNNRLIAKFEIPNNNIFWGADFNKIPPNALYPDNDYIESICKEIGQELDSEVAPSELGNFLKLWTQLEQKLINSARKYQREVHNFRFALTVLMKYEEKKKGYLKEFDILRMFRNKLVHKPTEISKKDLSNKLRILRNLMSEYN